MNMCNKQYEYKMHILKKKIWKLKCEIDAKK